MAAMCGVPCGAACGATFATCFSGDTEFNTTMGSKLISELKIGDEVLTDNTESTFTKVIKLEYLQKVTPMVTLNSEHSSVSLTVTPSHLHFVDSLDVTGSIVTKHAASVEVGMKMPRIDGTSFTVVSKTTSSHPGMWVLTTDACRAYANGILTTTNCADERTTAALSLLRVDSLRDIDINDDGKIEKSELVARLHNVSSEPFDTTHGPAPAPPTSA